MSDTKKDNKEVAIKDSEDKFRSVLKDFLKNDHQTFVVQKTEKLASALYMVTGFIPNDDPLRTRLRVCAVDLISTSADPSKARDVQYQEGFTSRCLEIATILKLAERAGFISGMNAQMLCDEYADLASFVKNHHDKVFGVLRVDVGEHTKKTEPTTEQKEEGSTHGKSGTPVVKKTINNKRHNSRRDAIMRLLDKKDKISIKDASSAISGCSGKTIQRELLSMVQDGVLLKEGERRWSLYRKA